MQSMEKLKPLALLLLRLALGVIFAFHGYPKLFTHTQETMQGFIHMGFPAYFAYIAGVIEFFGGCLLIVGLFTRVAGLFLAGEMAVALVKVQGILSNPMKVDAFGAGLISLDHAVFGGGARGSARKSKNKDRD
jgi:uncharacterized membrane protein YphA (DoxX/SURF4 family)